MKRWTIKELSETTDLKFAACILRERRAPLNPYSPLAQKLEDSKNMLLRMDGYLTWWGSGASLPPQKVVEILYRDGYHSAARLIEDLTADLGATDREHELLNACFTYLTNALPKPTLRRALRKEIGLTEQEIKKYQMEWVLEDHYDGEEEV